MSLSALPIGFLHDWSILFFNQEILNPKTATIYADVSASKKFHTWCYFKWHSLIWATWRFSPLSGNTIDNHNQISLPNRFWLPCPLWQFYLFSIWSNTFDKITLYPLLGGLSHNRKYVMITSQVYMFSILCDFQTGQSWQRPQHLSVRSADMDMRSLMGSVINYLKVLRTLMMPLKYVTGE